MIGSRRAVRGAVGAAALVLAAGGLAGCGSGQEAETSVQYPHIDGAVADLGSIGLRNVFIDPGPGGIVDAGGDAYIHMTIVNTGQDADTFTGASSPVAASVEAGQLAQAGSSSPSATASPSPSVTTTAEPFQASSGSLRIAPGGRLIFRTPFDQTQAPALRLHGLKQQLRAGQTVQVTFAFGNAGSVAVLVPVTHATGTTETATPVPSPTEASPTMINPPGSATPYPSPSASPAEVHISISPSANVTVAPTG